MTGDDAEQILGRSRARTFAGRFRPLSAWIYENRPAIFHQGLMPEKNHFANSTIAPKIGVVTN
jgi:hypothetical protein